ncbi:MAG: EAL domain-containing protein [Actinobacteria bacterium]|nr:EAL domain-containing protein [Actinomycetota bacterium]
MLRESWDAPGRRRPAVRASGPGAAPGGRPTPRQEAEGAQQRSAAAGRQPDRGHGRAAGPFEVNGVAPTVDASIGVAMLPEHGRTYASLFHHADRAMYAAKTVRGTCAVYDPHREAGDRERLALLGELGPAMRRADLVLYYQPQVELASGRATGAEALVRWDRAGGDLLPPDRFVPETERTGLIHSLTHYVLERALRQLRAWRDQGLEPTVAVNLSVRNLLDARLPETVVGLLRQWDVPPHSVTLEITESVVMVDEQRSLQVLRRLAAQDVRLALDDYDTGYASLAYLRACPSTRSRSTSR